MQMQNRRSIGACDSEVRRVPLANLRDADGPRTGGVDFSHVRLLSQTDTAFPPILVHRETMRVVDGMHRVAAAWLMGCADIEARFFLGSDDEAFRIAVEANTSHGLPLCLADRQAAAERIVRSHPELSDRSIARNCGLAATTVAGIRARTSANEQASVRIGRDGRARPLATVQGRIHASQFIARKPGASLREIARESGISIGTARDVRLRLESGEDPIPSRYRADPLDAAAPHEQPRSGGTGAILPDSQVEGVLAQLRRDPALRLSDRGRVLLRWLDSRTMTENQWLELAIAPPPHSRPMIARLAKHCARVWADLAKELSHADGVPPAHLRDEDSPRVGGAGFSHVRLLAQTCRQFLPVLTRCGRCAFGERSALSGHRHPTGFRIRARSLSVQRFRGQDADCCFVARRETAEPGRPVRT